MSETPVAEGASEVGRLEVVFSGLAQRLADWLPQLLAAAALMVAGWILAHLLRLLTQRLVSGLDRLLRYLPFGNRERLAGNLLSPAFIGGLVFWITLLAFVAAAAGVVGLTVFQVMLDQILGHLPLVVAAVLILVLGVVAARLVRDGVSMAAVRLEYRAAVGYAAQVAVLTLAAVIALDLVGLDITFVVVIAAILLGAAAGAMALAFGLGAQGVVANLLAARHLRRHVHEGDEVRLGELEGRIVELTPQAVVLETDEGRTTVPARMFSEHPSTVLIREQPRG